MCVERVLVIGILVILFVVILIALDEPDPRGSARHTAAGLSA